MKVGRRFAILLAVVLAGALSLVGAQASKAAHAETATASAKPLVIWVDSYRQKAVTKIADQWAATRGVSVKVVVKSFGNLRTDLATVASENAPDVLLGAADWVGEFAANGSVVPLFLRNAIKHQFPAYSLAAMSYGGKLYAVPTQLENIGLVVNLAIAHAPKTFADLERQALAFKAKASGNIAIAVPQGSGGDPYHMYPFFSGLCGYIFGHTKSGALNSHNIGVANPKFLKNSVLIDKWNAEGLIDSKIAYGDAKNAFMNQKAAFWITGPWETDSLKSSGIRFRIVQVPKIKCRSVPFLGVQGLFVTKFAAGHGVGSLAKDLVTNYMTKPAGQYNLAIDNSRYPANIQAGKLVHDAVLAQFGRASTGGVPIPNIPQMASVWGDLGTAWIVSTKGSGATKARVAFTTAANNIRAKIGG
jgi:arabinogalactan oligomer / maltooligosaccharide transport system substrate-binding protein